MIKELELTLPPASVTQDSAAVIWDRSHDVDYYDVYVNGEFGGSVRRGDYTADGLLPDADCEIFVAGMRDGRRVCSGSVSVRTKPSGEVYDVRDFGAKGDGRTLDTEAVTKAIDACGDGDTVLLTGGVYLCGAVYLKSNMRLYIAEDAVLKGSENPADYPIRRYRWEGRECDCYSSLVNTDFNGKRAENIIIEGRGRIDASGSVLRRRENAEGRAARGRAVCIRNTDGVYIKDITVKHSPAWCLHTIYCRGVTLNNVRIFSRYDEQRSKVYEGIINGDGFDPDSCSDVYVFDSLIASQDDCIAIKSGRDEEGRAVGIPSENIRVTDCCFENGLALAVGSETSGDVRNVLFRDCTLSHVYSCVSVKAPRGRGGVIENVVYENIKGEYSDDEFTDCEWFRGAVYVDNFYSKIEFDPSAAEPVGDGTPRIRNITVRNIDMRSTVSNAIYLAGLPESPLEDIVLENVKVDGKFGMKAYNVRGLAMTNVEINAHEGDAYTMVNVS